MQQPQVVIITGPTATGKTDLALDLATGYEAEIVSADSRQVYRYLDIGTAKPTPVQRALVPHHLLDVVDPDERFDSARFRALALETITTLTRRGKRVLVVGGPGLYLRALTQGLCPAPPADLTVRTQLQEQEQNEGCGFLHRWLRSVDPVAADRLHPNDTIRLIRALEVFLLSGTPLSQWQHAHRFQERPFSMLTIGLVMERETLHRRIEQRCHQMVEEGLIAEVQGLWARGYHPDLPLFQTIGYAQIGAMLRGQYGLEEALALMARETRRLAKRQLTWLRAEPNVHWFAPRQRQEMTREIEEFWGKGYVATYAD